MLVLSRKQTQQVMIGDHVVLTIVGISGGRVKLGITAPQDVRIRRGELLMRDDVTAGHLRCKGDRLPLPR